MRLKRLVGRLCQTPGEWDVGTSDQVRSIIIALRVPPDTGGLQTLSMRSPVGRLCQTPGEWDVGTSDQVRSIIIALRVPLDTRGLQAGA
jgi:hypothetical protein